MSDQNHVDFSKAQNMGERLETAVERIYPAVKRIKCNQCGHNVTATGRVAQPDPDQPPIFEHKCESEVCGKSFTLPAPYPRLTYVDNQKNEVAVLT